MRGAPLTHVPKNLTNPRGFFVTRSQTGTPTSFTETETFATEPSTLSIEQENRTEKSTEVPTSLYIEESPVYTGTSETTTQRSRRRTTSSSFAQTPSSTDYATTRQVVRDRGRTRHRATTPSITHEESVSETITVPTTIKPSSFTASKISTGSTLAITSIIESTIAPTTDLDTIVTYRPPNDFTSSSTEETYQTSTESSTIEDTATEMLTTPKEPGPEEMSSTAKKPSTKEDLHPTTLTATLPTTKASTETPGTPARGAQRFNSHEFGRRGSRDRPRVKSPIEDQENSVKRTQLPRRRFYRGRQRRPGANHVSTDSIPEESSPKDLTERNDSSPAKEGHERNAEEQVGIKDNVGRSEPEVNSTRSTVASPRTPGSPSTNRFRKPSGFTLTPPRNKSPNTITTNRNNSPTEGVDKLGVTENVSETAKPEKDIDQSSRAQEIAVTLAEPPLSQTPATGRPSLRDALRRRISTTLSPRTDSTTPRTAVSFSAARKDRQKPKTQDRPQQNATSRPRRPQVIDYDYYEDEEEPVVGKSTFNGKLFLTNQGSIRCLDQGNFPHPYSCRKFITCARMVNGLVVGAEYTCPDKLSYDPVGGICNWSAGLGCKE